MNSQQYEQVQARRLQQENLLWQTPALAMAGLALLLSSAFNPDVTKPIALLLSLTALLVASGCIQLMAKHRHLELADSKLLEQFESANEGYEELHKKGERISAHNPSTRFEKWLVNLPAYNIWMGLMAWFWIVSLIGLFVSIAQLLDTSSAALSIPKDN